MPYQYTTMDGGMLVLTRVDNKSKENAGKCFNKKMDYVSYDIKVIVDNYVEIGDFYQIKVGHVKNCVRKMWINLQAILQNEGLLAGSKKHRLNPSTTKKEKMKIENGKGEKRNEIVSKPLL